MTTVAPYGSWASPITPELTVAGAVWLGEVRVDGATTYWSELRPSEGGRVQLVFVPVQRVEHRGELDAQSHRLQREPVCDDHEHALAGFPGIFAR